MSEKKYNDIQVKKQVTAEETVSVELTEKRTLEKVVSVQPKKVKRGLISRLVGGVMGPDGASSVGEYVNNEIIMPAIKNIIVDVVTSGVNMIVYGARDGRGGRSGGYQQTYQQRTNYSQRSTHTSRYTQTNPEPVVIPRGRQGIQDYLIEDRNEASDVLAQLVDNANIYGSVSVADYYELIGAPSVYTDNDYGWYADAIQRAILQHQRGGYVIKFPQIEVIK